jgi:flavin reductase (NADH)/flavin reductase/chlorophenol-4-monooxygenase component 1
MSHAESSASSLAQLALGPTATDLNGSAAWSSGFAASLDHPGGSLPGITVQEFRDALSKAVTPVTVLATNGAGGIAGVTCSAVCSVCDTPPTVLVCVNRKSYANRIIRANGVLSINWLRAEQSVVSQIFSGAGSLPMEQRFASTEWGTLATGAPYNKGALVALDCRIVEEKEVGSHSVFLAEIIATAHSDSTDPLVYCRRAYATTRPVNA